MKKIFTLIIVILLVLSGCKYANEENSSKQNQSLLEESMNEESNISSSPEIEEDELELSDIEIEQQTTLNACEWKANEKSTLEEAYADMDETPELEIEIANEYPFTGEYKDVFPVVNNSEPLEKIISEISNPSFIYTATNSLEFSFTNNTGIKLCDILCTDLDSTFLDSLPINYLRRNAAGNYYTVLKLNGGGYVYYFFVENYDSKFTDEETWQDYETFSVAKDDTDLIFQGAVYLEKKLSYKDTDAIKEGNSILEISKIAPSVLMTLNRRDFYRDVYHFNNIYDIEYTHVLLLEDGVLELVFGPGAELTLKEKNYYPDFNYYPSNIKVNEYHNSFCINIEILEQDYPPAS